MWDSNSRGTTPLGRRGSDSRQRLSFIAAPFESLFAKRKRTPTVFESRFLCGIRILAALRRSVVAVLTAVKGCHSLPLRSNPRLPKGKGHRRCPFPFGLPWGIRTPNRQNRNLILYPIALRADMKSLAGFICFRKALSDFRHFYKTAFLSVPMKVQAGL